MLDRAAPEDRAAWQRRLGFELGMDLEVIGKGDELETWFRRIHGIRVAAMLTGWFIG